MIYAYLDTFCCRWQAFNACKRVGAPFSEAITPTN